MNIFDWESTVYPKIFHEVMQIGRKAKEEGLPRICNLGENFRTPSGVILKVWLDAWEQGYDNHNPIPEEFRQIEELLNRQPLRKI